MIKLNRIKRFPVYIWSWLNRCIHCLVWTFYTERILIIVTFNFTACKGPSKCHLWLWLSTKKSEKNSIKSINISIYPAFCVSTFHAESNENVHTWRGGERGSDVMTVSWSVTSPASSFHSVSLSFCISEILIKHVANQSSVQVTATPAE